MAIALEITIQSLAGNPGAVDDATVNGQGNTANHVECLEVGITSSSPTYTLYLPANTISIVDMSSVFTGSGSGMTSGSWPGNINDWDMYELVSYMTGSGSGATSGSWPGNINVWDMYELPQEDHNHLPIAEDNPQSLQSAETVIWNYFPIPPIPPLPPTKPRDLTRYQKTYSFSRYMPVRVRFYKR